MKTVKSLKSATQTEIFNFVAKKFGKENIKNKVYDFLKNHSSYGCKIAYRMAYVKPKKIVESTINTPIANIVAFAKNEKTNKSNYSKILIMGNNNIYWASKVYGHKDYNKSIAMPINNTSIKLMNLVNSYLNK